MTFIDFEVQRKNIRDGIFSSATGVINRAFLVQISPEGRLSLWLPRRPERRLASSELSATPPFGRCLGSRTRCCGPCGAADWRGRPMSACANDSGL